MAEVKREQTPLCELARGNGHVFFFFNSLITAPLLTSHWLKQVSGLSQSQKWKRLEIYRAKSMVIRTALIATNLS